MNFVRTLLASCLSLAALNAAQAAVSTDQAARLGTSLTAIGAEKAGNADGSIPAYQGGLLTPPASYQSGASMRPDPFASDKPLLVIDGKNAEQYKGQLTATTLELLKRYPSYRVDVYPTHRSVALPQAVLDNTRKNATAANSQEGGTAVDNVLPGIRSPFRRAAPRPCGTSCCAIRA